MISQGRIDAATTWVETSALLVTKVTGEPFQQYFMLVITNMMDEEDVDELRRLEGELGKSLADCVVEREWYEKAHPAFPGSTSFHVVTVYGG
jgi:hypothetical protein